MRHHVAKPINEFKAVGDSCVIPRSCVRQNIYSYAQRRGWIVTLKVVGSAFHITAKARLEGGTSNRPYSRSRNDLAHIGPNRRETFTAIDKMIRGGASYEQMADKLKLNIHTIRGYINTARKLNLGLCPKRRRKQEPTPHLSQIKQDFQLPTGLQLFAVMLGKRFTATVADDGTIEVAGIGTYNSLSLAANAVTHALGFHGHRNGWNFWHTTKPDGVTCTASWLRVTSPSTTT